MVASHQAPYGYSLVRLKRAQEPATPRCSSRCYTAAVVFSRDTSLEAERLLVQLLRRKSLGEKLAMIDGAFATGRMLALSGIRWRHPGADPATIEREFYRLMLGEELGDRVLAAKRARAAE